MQYTVRTAADEDSAAIMNVFNHYVENSFAAYPDRRVPGAYFAAMKEAGGDYPLYVAVDGNGAVVGFGMLRQHQRADAFKHTAEIGYFILPEHTDKGLGRDLLSRLEKAALDRGIRVLLANISSLNEKSLNFHRAHGFTECGRFQRIGVKFGREFDVVWMQKFL
jgi:L-amino acid N-acyltransferase YncA